MANNELILKRFRLVLDTLYRSDAARMAQEMGVNRTTITRYINGDVTPTKKALHLLSLAKRIRLTWLLGDGGDSIEYDNAFEFALPRLQSPIAGDSPIDSMSSRQSIPFYCRPGMYYLHVNEEMKANGILVHDHCLIQQITPRPASECDCEKLRVVERTSKIQMAVVSIDDVKSSTLVHGILRRIERDFED